MRNNRISPVRRRGHFEQLESRIVLDGNPSIGLAEPYLTLSFAPDGTDVAGQPSELAATFDQVAPTTLWQDAILRAFQTWAVHTNADIGLVADSGLPLGTAGATNRDLRFGDVRIAGAALPAEFGAISVSITSLVGGTWSGDVVFNTAFAYQSVDDIFAIALHEAGNVFGLLDNTDPNSPLNAGPIPTATVPTANDIALLQTLHGQRAADVNELDDDNEVERNDTRGDATDWQPIEVDGQPNGAFPALAYGDIQSPSDIDYFELEIPDGYTGPLTVQLRTSGVSLLRGTLTIENGQGVVLASASGSGVRGDLVSLTLPTVQAGSELFVRVEAAATDLYGIGGYSLIAIFDAANTATPAAIDSATNGSLRRIEVGDLAGVFAIDEVRFAPDLGTNDTLANATPLSSAAGFVEGSRFEVLASIDQGDQDFYRIDGIEYSTGDTLVVALRSLDAGRLVPDVSVFDSLGNPLSTTVLANGGGQLLLEVELSEQNNELYLQVAADSSSGPFSSGNYILQAGVMTQATSLALIDSGQHLDQSSERVRLLYVAEPQLFHFVVDSVAISGDAIASVEFSIRDANGNVIYELSAPEGTSRSSSAAFLPVGQYELVTRAISLDPAASLALGYAVRGRAFSDPFVSDGSDPTTNPFVCEPGSGFYCYPGEIISSDPLQFGTDTTIRPFTNSEQSTIEIIELLVGDWWNWVWSTATDNFAPVASDDFLSVVGGAGAAGLVIAPINLLDNDSDADSDPLIAVITSLPEHGELAWNPNGTFSYRPNDGFVGYDSFVYVASDFVVASSEATVTIEVLADDTLPGDYNADNVVDQLDYTVWRSQFGTAAGTADGNRDGFVNAADYTVWRDNLGASRDSAAMLAISPIEATTETSAPTASSSTMVIGLDASATRSSREHGTHNAARGTRLRTQTIATPAGAAVLDQRPSKITRDVAFSQWQRLPSDSAELAEGLLSESLRAAKPTDDLFDSFEVGLSLRMRRR